MDFFGGIYADLNIGDPILLIKPKLFYLPIVNDTLTFGLTYMFKTSCSGPPTNEGKDSCSDITDIMSLNILSICKTVTPLACILQTEALVETTPKILSRNTCIWRSSSVPHKFLQRKSGGCHIYPLV